MATQLEVAEHLDLSDRQIRELLTKGALPKPRARGEMDLDACRLGYIRHLRDMAAGRDARLAEERTRLAAEQADAQAMKNAAERRDLLPRDQIGIAVAASFAHVRDRLREAPARYAAQLARITKPDEVRRRLVEIVDGALLEISQTQVEAIAGDGGRIGRPAGRGKPRGS